MKAYNGHRSWNAWNVALWLYNDSDWYSMWCTMPEQLTLNKAINKLMQALPARTPDGATLNRLAIKLAIEENWFK